MNRTSASALLFLALMGVPSAAFAQSADGTTTPGTSETRSPAASESAGGGQSPAPAAGDAEAATPQEPAPSAIGGDEVSSIAGSLSPLIEDVQVVGPWREGDRTGVWRAVMAREPAAPTRTQFFLQQIAPSAHGAQILRSVAVEEIAAIEGTIVGYTADEPTPGEEGSLTLFFEIVPDGAEISETYELHARPDASYDFGPATN